MRKHWTFGLILLVALAGCGDKKADQAKALQQELQDMLAKAAGADKKITYGDVAVTPDGDVFDASVDKLAIPIAGSEPIDLGKITFKLTPDGDDNRKFTDLTLPASVAVKDTGGTVLAKLDLAVDHANGAWSKKLGQLTNADFLFKTVTASNDSSGDKLVATAVAYQLASTDGGQGIWDQQASLGAKEIDYTGKDGQASIADLSASSNVGGAKLDQIIALRDDLKKAVEANKPADMIPLLGKILSLVKSMKVAIAMGKITASTGGQPMFTLGGFGFDFGLDGLDQPKAKMTSGIKYSGLSIPDLKAMAGPAGADLVPTDFGLKYGADDLPLATMIDLAGKNLANVSMTDETAMMGAGMALAGTIDQAFAQAATKIYISDGTVAAPAFNAKFDGNVQAQQNAAMGGSGELNLQVSDLDAVIARVQQYTDDPQKDQIVASLQMLKQMSDPGTDDAGKKIDKFKVTLDQDGKTLVNGKPLPMD